MIEGLSTLFVDGMRVGPDGMETRGKCALSATTQCHMSTYHRFLLQTQTHTPRVCRLQVPTIPIASKNWILLRIESVCRLQYSLCIRIFIYGEHTPFEPRVERLSATLIINSLNNLVSHMPPHVLLCCCFCRLSPSLLLHQTKLWFPNFVFAILSTPLFPASTAPSSSSFALQNVDRHPMAFWHLFRISFDSFSLSFASLPTSKF